MAIAQEFQKKDYNSAYLRTKLAEILESPDSQVVLLKAIELGMRSQGDLIDKRETTVTQRPTIPLKNIKTEELQEELVKRLKLSAQGVQTFPTAENGENSTESKANLAEIKETA
jgi:hypothetical protein